MNSQPYISEKGKFGDLRKSISTSQLSVNSGSSENYYSGLVKCPLCVSTIKEAQMCPNCCKLFCFKCIKEWFLSNKQNCPSCCKSLAFSSMVNCDLLGKQILGLFESRSPGIDEASPPGLSPALSKQLTPNYSSPDILTISSVKQISAECSEHSLPLEYYCETCCEGICSDCAVLTLNHRGHKLCKLSLKKQSFISEIQQLHNKIRSLRNSISQNKDQAIHKLTNSKTIQKQKLDILTNYLKRILQNATQKFDVNLKEEEEAVYKMREKQKQLMIKFATLERGINTPLKTKLINESVSYENTLKNVLDKEFKSMQFNRKQMEQVITPGFDKKVFILDNYTYLKDKSEILYSEPFFWKGIEWKLKIYPGGLNKQECKGQQQYLAMYLEMTRGNKRRLNTYRYKIELINQVDRNRVISRTFQSEFQQGMCWGYDSFAKISTLYDEKFVHPAQDYLQIILHVKSPTYYHAVQDQSHQIHQKQLYKSMNLQNIRSLRKLAGIEGMNLNTMDKNSQIVRALIDESVPKNCMKRVKSNSDMHSIALDAV